MFYYNNPDYHIYRCSLCDERLHTLPTVLRCVIHWQLANYSESISEYPFAGTSGCGIKPSHSLIGHFFAFGCWSLLVRLLVWTVNRSLLYNSIKYFVVCPTLPVVVCHSDTKQSSSSSGVKKCRVRGREATRRRHQSFFQTNKQMDSSYSPISKETRLGRLYIPEATIRKLKVVGVLLYKTRMLPGH